MAENNLGPDEREKFEAWIKQDGGDLDTFGSGSNMHYSKSAVNNAWTGWKTRAHIAARAALAAPAVVVSAEPVAAGALPMIPEDVLTYIHAYGDSRADDDGFSGIRIAEAILAIRRWARTLATPVGPDAVDARDGERYRFLRDGGISELPFEDYSANPRVLEDSIVDTAMARLGMGGRTAALASTPSKGAA